MNPLTISRAMEFRSLADARRSTTMRTRNCELPEAFVESTIAAGLNSLERSNVSAKASRRRAVDKACRMAEQPTRPCEEREAGAVEVISLKSPRVPNLEGLL